MQRCPGEHSINAPKTLAARSLAASQVKSTPPLGMPAFALTEVGLPAGAPRNTLQPGIQTMRFEHSRPVVPLRYRPPYIPCSAAYAPRNLLQAWTRVRFTPPLGIPAFALTEVGLPAGAPQRLHRWPSRAFKQMHFEQFREK